MGKFIRCCFAILIFTILLTSVTFSVKAADNALTCGCNPAFLGFDYERKISDKIAVELYYSNSRNFFVDSSGYGFGVKYYFRGNSLNGLYTGLNRSTIRVEGKPLLDLCEDLFGEPASYPYDLNYVAIPLGYKKVCTSGFTFDAAVLLCFGLDVEHPRLSATIGIGYGW